ncbi:PH domain-containing protein [Sediminitomix flava]|nr:PH domain-containing protein [Sediminitomix flava]
MKLGGISVDEYFSINIFFSRIEGVYIFYSLLAIPVFIIRPLIILLYNYLIYSNTTYRIKENEIEYCESFITENYSSIEYNKVIEVHLRKGIIQKLFKLGTIFLETPGSGDGRNGILIKDICNYEEAYKLINSLVRKK